MMETDKLSADKGERSFHLGPLFLRACCMGLDVNACGSVSVRVIEWQS